MRLEATIKKTAPKLTAKTIKKTTPRLTAIVSASAASSGIWGVTEEDNGKIAIVVDGKWQQTAASVYKGDYEAIPTTEAQTLNTEQKLLEKDITIHAIPYYRVGNPSGGNTVYIATMDEDPSGAFAILGKSKLGTMIL